MPSRNQTLIRRDINRLEDVVQREKDKHAVFEVLAPLVSDRAGKVNITWQALQAARVNGVKERDERDSDLGKMQAWIQRWRPTLFLLVPGAAQNIYSLPSTGATPDDVLRVGDDMAQMIRTNAGAESMRAKALADLGTLIEDARRNIAEASQALPVEAAMRDAHTTACLQANDVLYHGLMTVRAVFGPKSPEYKQFVAKGSTDEEDAAEPQTDATAP